MARIDLTVDPQGLVLLAELVLLKLTGLEIGSQTRPWISVQDVLKAQDK